MERINTFFYSVVQGFKNIKRNRMFSITSIFTITACLFLFGIFYFLVSNVQYMIKNMEGSVAITAFFEEGITDSRISEIGQEIKKNTNVTDVVYVSAEDAWKKFQSDIFEDQEELVETFSTENPLEDSASYEVYVSDVSNQKKVAKEIEEMEGIRKVISSGETVQTLTIFNRLISAVSFFVIAILFCVSLFLISTTITIGISVRKEEIAIMRLIGATDFFVQGPFIVEGIMIGLIGAVLPIGILAIVYRQVIGEVSERFAQLSQWLVFLDLKSEFSVLFPVCLGIGVGIGLLGSCITVKKHLRV